MENSERTIMNELNGLTKKEYFAIQILSGLASKYTLSTPEDQEILAKLSIEMAETFINELKSN